jgi:two-component system sensor histidine kinase DegS
MIQFDWLRPLRAVRVVLGIACVLNEYAVTHSYFTGLVWLFVAYTVYGSVVWLGKSLEATRFSPLALAVDGIFLFLCLTSGAIQLYWVPLFFFIYVLLISILWHQWSSTLVIAVLSAGILQVVHPPYYEILLPSVVCSGCLGALVSIDRHLLKDQLDKSSRRIALYRYDAEKARNTERERIAADFHDGPLQSFISFQMRLEIIRKLLIRDLDAARDELMLLQEICKDQIQDLRTFLRSMRPVDLDGSLNASLRRVIEQFQKDSGIPASFFSADFPEPNDPEIALELLQIVREALYNVHKHSAATRVAVSIQKTDRAMEITVEDNGNGFPFSGRYTLEELELLRLGPGSIKRRVRSLGGELVLDSKPGQGAGLKVRLTA